MVQEPEIAVDDPRWIVLRVSRINLLISAIGVLVALGMLVLVPLPLWARVGIALIFMLAFLWDLRWILLKSSDSVSAFYLFDRDAAHAQDGSSLPPAKLGIRVRYAATPASLAQQEAEGVILGGGFVSPWFTTVRFTLPQDPRWRKWWPHIIPLWPDSAAAESFRRVRVALKWK